MLLDHQAAHIYTYMGQNIPNILGFFGLKKAVKDLLCLERLNYDIEISEGVDSNILKIKINNN